MLEEKFPGPYPFRAVDAFNSDEPIYKLYDVAIARAQDGQFDTFLKRLRYFLLYQAAQQAAALFPNGNFVECGCWHGHSTFMLATLMQAAGSTGKLHVFDAFEGGLSEFHELDKGFIKTDDAIRNITEQFKSNEEKVRSLLAPFPFVSFYPGWIPDRFSEVAEEEFCFLSIDVDLYEPTLKSMEFFWPRLMKGGFAYFDDYGTNTFPGARIAIERFFEASPPAALFRLPFGAAVAIR